MDGDGTFSTAKTVPRLRFENKINELELLNKIKNYLNIGNIGFNYRTVKPNSKNTCILDITNIYHLKNILIPLFSKKEEGFQVLNTKKFNDFKLWTMIVNINFCGYNKIEEGIKLIEEIKTRLNKLSTNRNNLINQKFIDFDLLMKNLFSLVSPYEIKNGIRFLRNTNNLISTGLRILCRNKDNNQKQIFSSISECSKALNLNRQSIKKYLLNGEKYYNYTFHFYYE